MEPAEAGLRPQRNILALSSGGLYGAYSTGFLAGWTATGTRPEFDTVTGVSVGSLIAPYAFLGPELDPVTKELHTGTRAEDVFRIRAWVTIPFKDAVASSAPLRQLIESQITPELLARVATEHRKGRRLYVGTTNLKTRRLVVWDMGEIACLKNGSGLFRDVLLASCSVPGMLPPVAFAVQSECGEWETELHADGGITSQIFVPSHVFRAVKGPAIDGANGNLYAIVAGKLYPDAGDVKPRVLPILGATTEAVMYAHCRVELANLYGQARLAGMRYQHASLRQDLPVNAETLISIDQGEMQKLYREGEQDGTNGPRWEYTPPDLCGPAPVYFKIGTRPRKR
jgi:predicted acylesterase/phospholipase RssA